MKAADRIEVGRIYTAWLGPNFTRRAKVVAVDQDGQATVVYPDYPTLRADYVDLENLS